MILERLIFDYAFLDERIPVNPPGESSERSAKLLFKTWRINFDRREEEEAK